MKKLHRIFLAISVAFFSASVLMQIIPTMFIRSTSEHVSNCLTSDDGRHESFSDTEVEVRKTLPAVWDTSSMDDRIVAQIDYIPNGIETTENPKVLWLRGFDVPDGPKMFQTCKVNTCTITTNNAFLKRHIDAKMFNMEMSFTTVREHQQFPRPRDQVWILYALESPMATPSYYLLEGLFNWTATYRRDSTLVTPYEKWVPYNKNHVRKFSKNYAKGKKHRVAIYVSNCETSNDRLDYVDQLSLYIDVHVYGACGNDDYYCNQYLNESLCYENLKKNYKFYLAFENSNCRDYITEKFFRNALMHDVVPVVMGAHPEEYRQSAPPNSFIHVEDFSSPRDLANYLHKLDENDDLYNKYFDWKGTGSFIDTKFWCRLCALLNDPNKPELIINSLSHWWRPPRVCLRQDQKWLQPDKWPTISKRKVAYKQTKDS